MPSSQGFVFYRFPRQLGNPPANPGEPVALRPYFTVGFASATNYGGSAGVMCGGFIEALKTSMVYNSTICQDNN